MPNPITGRDVASFQKLEDGRVFVINAVDSFNGRIQLLQRDGQLIKEWKTDRSPSLLAYDRIAKNLFVMGYNLQRYSFDEGTLELMAQERCSSRSETSSRRKTAKR